MRIRATVAAVSGALVLPALALALPAVAQADARPTLTGDTTITKVVVNGGKDLAFGTSTKKSFTATVTATDPDGIEAGWVALWHGTSLDTRDATLLPTEEGTGTCTATDAQTSTCTVHFSVDVAADLKLNSLAGTWHVYADAYDNNNDFTDNATAGTIRIKRHTKLTADASPEPVKKGKTITVKGALTRANWETGKYTGLSGQSVKLQFRKADSDTYTTLKTVTSTTGGALKATTTAKSDGYYRFVYAGTKATNASKSGADFVNVQ